MLSQKSSYLVAGKGKYNVLNCFLTSYTHFPSFNEHRGRVAHPCIVVGGPHRPHVDGESDEDCYELANISHKLLDPQHRPVNKYHPKLTGNVNVGKPAVARARHMGARKNKPPLGTEQFSQLQTLRGEYGVYPPTYGLPHMSSRNITWIQVPR
jgi:hypothetical protein